ncbi:universal stress protein UspA [Sulfodiicoccus acidiphilus]|uniref:Universal stress protein UspA n=2 Tax=Sulfodiicoccus acidiphilus TaxID=1670455 RepID=A0A348B0K4_9CREN|nr:universal stress protein UspA [Sulfodiicoccus acidiphilus]GGT86465.1 universal stress protein UspA [Sulfodiicoccus acidiphilus]
MFTHIVVAYDGSEPAKRALNAATEIALKFNSQVDVIHVVDTLILAANGVSPIPDEVIRTMYDRAKSTVEEAASSLSAKGVKVKAVTLDGDPANSILEYATKNGADLIVAGSRGLSTLKRIMLGSVSTRLVTDSRIPVLVVK